MENRGQSFAQLYHQALVNPKELSLEDFDVLLAKYPYSQPLHFAFERRKFMLGELNTLGSKAILLANSPNWLYEYVQLPVRHLPYQKAVDTETILAVQEVDTLDALAADVDSQDADVSLVSHDEAEQEEPESVEADLAVAEEPVALAPEIAAEESSLEQIESAAEGAVDGDVTVEEQYADENQSVAEETPEEDVLEEDALTAPAAEDEEFTEAAIADVLLPAEQDEGSIVEAASTGELQETFVAEETDEQLALVTAAEQDQENASDADITIKEAELNAPTDSEQEAELEEEEAVVQDREELKALETLVQEGIGGGDYFALHNKEIRWQSDTRLSPLDKPAEEEQKPEEQKEADDVSVYNDELMPYSFRWWLHKTRLEYADTYQPFANAYLPTNKKSSFDPIAFDKVILDQQIRENIIHLQDPEDKLSDEVKKRAVTYNRVDKTTAVIEKFIREEPQIQPPPADQLNMENKARKSSEEQYDLVTETLANIYAGQAMYVKAIEVYKKLILKYPEKKSYFATRIEELEEKLY